MLIIAHRGASGTAPENTLAAFRRAWDLGVDGIELDIHLTRDGVPVCSHDARTGRVSNKDHAIRGPHTRRAQAHRCRGLERCCLCRRSHSLRSKKCSRSCLNGKTVLIEVKEVPARDLAHALKPILDKHREYIANRQIYFMSFFPDLLWTLQGHFPDLTLLPASR